MLPSSRSTQFSKFSTSLSLSRPVLRLIVAGSKSLMIAALCSGGVFSSSKILQHRRCASSGDKPAGLDGSRSSSSPSISVARTKCRVLTSSVLLFNRCPRPSHTIRIALKSPDSRSTSFSGRRPSLIGISNLGLLCRQGLPRFSHNKTVGAGRCACPERFFWGLVARSMGRRVNLTPGRTAMSAPTKWGSLNASHPNPRAKNRLNLILILQRRTPGTQ